MDNADSRAVHHWRKPCMSIEVIAIWLEGHLSRHGKYPSANSEVIDGVGLTWLAVDKALKNGYRGLPGGQSLAQVRDALIAGERIIGQN